MKYSLSLLGFLILLAPIQGFTQAARDSAPVLNVTVSNRTPFDLSVEGQTVRAGASASIRFPQTDQELAPPFGFDFDIPIGPDYWQRLRGAEKTIRKGQTSLDLNPQDIDLNNLRNDTDVVYLTVRNRSQGAISIGGDRSFLAYWKQSGPFLVKGTDYQFPPGTVAAYQAAWSTRSENRLAIAADQNRWVLFPSAGWKPLWRYSYEYSDGKLELLDARPLILSSEPSWTLPAAQDQGRSPWLVQGEGGVYALESWGQKTELRLLGTGGVPSTPRKTVWPGPLRVSAAINTAGGWLLAGNPIEGSGIWNLPLGGSAFRVFSNEKSRILSRGGGGTITCVGLRQPDLAGIAGSASGYLYFAEVGTNAVDRPPVREYGLNALGKVPDRSLGPARALLWNPSTGTWIVAGSWLSGVSGNKGSYVIQIPSDIPPVRPALKITDRGIKQILKGSAGKLLLIGDQWKAGSVFAAVAEYDPSGDTVESCFAENAPGSSYQRACLDAGQKVLYLTGVRNGSDSAGTGGIPFLDAVDTVTWTRLWSRDLTVLQGAQVADDLALGAEYGFFVSFSGIASGDYAPPYGVARLGATGNPNSDHRVLEARQ